MMNEHNQNTNKSERYNTKYEIWKTQDKNIHQLEHNVFYLS